MDVIQEAREKGAPLKKDIKILTAGDKFSEKFRNDFLDFLGVKNIKNSFINIYGSADTGILAHETPLSIFLRREALKNKQLFKDIFGKTNNLPGLYQYNPENIFIEEVNGELALTANTASPLVRYNIHDLGRVITHDGIKKILAKFNLQKKALNWGLDHWKIPFVVVHGRTDVAVTFFALNIFPDDIKAGVEGREASKFLSGSFFARAKTLNHSKNQKLCIELELNAGVRPSQKIIKLAQDGIMENLLKLNAEFRKLYSTIGKRAIPKINLHPRGNFNYTAQKGVLNVFGKKPKMIL